MDKELIEIEELLRRRNAEIASQLRVRNPMKSVQEFAKLLAEVLSVRR